MKILPASVRCCAEFLVQTSSTMGCIFPNMAATGSYRFDDSAKEEVRSRVDLGAIIGRYVALKPAGQNLKGLCPFHKEKTPSFTVNPARGFFHCFGCGKGGDVFTFLTEIEGLTFSEALRKLAEETGVKLSERSAPASAPQQSALPKQELLRIHAVAAQYYYDYMRQSERAKEYLKARGLRGETVKEFRIGYAPEGWSNLIAYCQGKGIGASSLLACGLARTKSEGSAPYDQFRDRIIFPIFDLSSQVIAFGGRALEKEAVPKYLNSPETPLYRKSRTLYGLNRTRTSIKDENRVLIVEGYMDFLALYQAGIRNIVATCGTALTGDHAQILRRFASRAVLVFDGDAAGQSAAQRGAAALIPQGLDVRVLLLPHDEDPDSYILRHGKEAFMKLLDAAIDAYQFLIDKAMAEGDAQTAQGKSAIAAFFLPVIQSTPDQIIRQELIRQLAQRLSIREDLLYSRLKKQGATPPGNAVDHGSMRNYLFTLEGKIIHLLYLYPELAGYARERISVEAFSDPISAELYSTMISAWESGATVEKAIAANATDEVKRAVSLLAVSPPNPGENHAEELQHLLRQLERRHLRQELAELRKRMHASIPQRTELLQRHKALTSRLALLDKNQ